MKITLFDTAIGTSNIGDEIIMKSAEEHINFLLKKSSVMRFATHLTNFYSYAYFRNKKNGKMKFADTSDFKFILGTNLLTNNMIKSRGQWPIDIFSKKLYKNSILYGVGRTFYNNNNIDVYTKYIYDYILREDIIHSVRDEEGKVFIEKLNRKAINTGCPTLWNLNENHCSKILKTKSSRVVITLSGQKKYQDLEYDKKFLNIIKKNYKEIFFWAQTIEDKPYYDSLKLDLNVKFIYNLSDYANLLKEGDIDYVGTRLHGGIFALQHKVRSIILAIDNRARGFKKINNIVSLERKDIDLLEDMINSKFDTNIYIRKKEISMWLEQFK